VSAEQDSALHEIEKRAMVGDKRAVLALVSFERHLRDAAKKLLDARYRDGECDAVALSRFASEVEEAAENTISYGAV
jgi:hypothetical protein